MAIQPGIPQGGVPIEPGEVTPASGALQHPTEAIVTQGPSSLPAPQPLPETLGELEKAIGTLKTAFTPENRKSVDTKLANALSKMSTFTPEQQKLIRGLAVQAGKISIEAFQARKKQTVQPAETALQTPVKPSEVLENVAKIETSPPGAESLTPTLKQSVQPVPLEAGAVVSNKIQSKVELEKLLEKGDQLLEDAKTAKKDYEQGLRESPKQVAQAPKEAPYAVSASTSQETRMVEIDFLMEEAEQLLPTPQHEEAPTAQVLSEPVTTPDSDTPETVLSVEDKARSQIEIDKLVEQIVQGHQTPEREEAPKTGFLLDESVAGFDPALLEEDKDVTPEKTLHDVLGITPSDITPAGLKEPTRAEKKQSAFVKFLARILPKAWFSKSSIEAPQKMNSKGKIELAETTSTQQAKPTGITTTDIKVSKKEQEMKALLPKFSTNKQKLIQKLMKGTKPVGDIVVSRSKINDSKAVLGMKVGESKPKIAQEPGFFGDSPKMSDDHMQFDVNFADSLIFAYSYDDKFAQDEIMQVKVPGLVAAREKLRDPKVGPPQLQDREACVITGLTRYGDVDTRGVYGDSFKTQSGKALEQTTPRKPEERNVIAIVATHAEAAGGQPVKLDKITQNFLTAYNGFLAAKQKAEAEGKMCQIDTGKWGAGAFGNNPVAMLAVQILAARAAGVDDIRFFTGKKSGEADPEFDQAQKIIDDFFTANKDATIQQALEHLEASGLKDIGGNKT